MEKEGDGAVVRLRVKNTGRRQGSEVVQVYVAPPASLVPRPVKELKGFSKVELKPGEEKEVSISLDFRAFAYWDGKWRVTKGAYRILVGSSSRDIRLCSDLSLDGDGPVSLVVGRTTTVRDVLESDEAVPAFRGMMEQVLKMVGNEPMFRETLLGSPLHSLQSFLPVSYQQILAMLGRSGDA
ncbi:MAG: fibronectin type III-like domain-contianing protein [Sphaerochaeta sp.]|nr:fibronectin type III-like domain-contianing protein [Sphaerochaeta sp.]